MENQNETVIEGVISETGNKPSKKESTELTVKSEINQPALIVGENSVEVATKVANALKDVVERQKLYVEIQRGKYVMVEGWNTLGALMGVFPEVVSVEKLPTRIVKMFQVEITKGKKNYQTGQWENYKVFSLMKPALYNPNDQKMTKVGEVDFEEISYRSIVMLKRAGDGQKVSQAEAFCSNLEESKEKNDEYAIMSMAQTRATGKVFRIAFSWIMKMAGYEATPAEEMPRDGFESNEPTHQAPKPTQTYARKEEPRYEPIKENTPPAQPWKKWEKPAPTNQARPVQQTRPTQPSASHECCGCGAVIAQVVYDYSMKFYGDPLCRECQKGATKIR